jgi:pyridoxamine 5'-phosphate oxidase
MNDVTSLRTDYAKGALDEADVAAAPHEQLSRWVDEAVAANAPEPNAMALTTVAADGKPSSRIVLLRGLDAEGLVFYTNYESKKGEDLAATGCAALLFFWPTLERQVRVEGAVSRVSAEVSEAYFRSRPRESRIGAWASAQSRPLATREALARRVEEVDARFPGDDVPLPPFWGGYRVVPERFEFWQGRPSRLHDRLVYNLKAGDGGWALQRLMP